MKYIVLYVENCTPKIKYCKSLSAAKRFATKFTKGKDAHRDGDWVDYVIEAKTFISYEAK